jgi:outer membrane immunogenic protein
LFHPGNTGKKVAEGLVASSDAGKILGNSMSQARSLRSLALSSCSAVALIAMAGTQAEAQQGIPNWAGFYVGGNIGYGKNGTRWTDNPTGVLSWTSFSGNAQSVNIDDDGVTFGLHAGYNFQIQRIVFGIETDITHVGSKGQYAWNVPNTWSGTQPGYITTKLDWIGTTRARLGVAIDNFLFFGTAGFAYGAPEAHWTQAISGAQWHSDGQQVVAVWGGGVEWMFNSNWSVRAEALVMDFNTLRARNVTLPTAADFGGASGYNMTTRTTETIARVGATFKF